MSFYISLRFLGRIHSNRLFEIAPVRRALFLILATKLLHAIIHRLTSCHYSTQSKVQVCFRSRFRDIHTDQEMLSLAADAIFAKAKDGSGGAKV